MKIVSVPTEKVKTMVVDIGIVKNHIKPKADSTLRNMRKDDLIEYIRCLENNYNVAVSFNTQQAKNIEALGIIEVVRCRDCKYWDSETGFCDKHSRFYHGGLDWDMFNDDDFCSCGERRTDG